MLNLFFLIVMYIVYKCSFFIWVIVTMMWQVVSCLLRVLSSSPFFDSRIYQICRTNSRATRKINFEESSQNLTISSLTEKSMEDANISLQVRSPCFNAFFFCTNVVFFKLTVQSIYWLGFLKFWKIPAENNNSFSLFAGYTRCIYGITINVTTWKVLRC